MSEIAVQERSRRKRWARPGSSHDRIVRTLLSILPAGIGVLGAFLVMAPLFMGGDVSFMLDKNKVDVASERLRIQSARYRGADAKGQAFVLQAGSAVQKSSAEPVVQLNDLTAGIQLTDGPAQVKAERGRYDMEREQVAVDGPIQFRTSDGYRLDTRDSTIDLKSRQLTGTGNVSGSTPLGNFSGDKMTADLDKRTVKIEGNARLRIDPKRANR
ncbi:LPS export ABC transporter periplasmic protein LptC [Sphingomonas sp.]|jgi:lipopolysaccharide export system protein LptC|uniref:LPS export ABC transporter periplasmic protein LptC n=1 Tax=Sphingomonas sp. TaxID=28214 RepID=UPI002634C817|nr:LPS export ABC transporter periplasmic protein LptC [Sphingomonas sp.]MDK2770203.1 LPS export ABC transporter periplasmic protein LptC [Sphingomonas sp.]